MIGLEGAGDSVELGYWLGQPYWEAGIAGRRSSVARHGLAGDRHRAGASVALLNPRSGHVLEKAGFVACGEG